MATSQDVPDDNTYVVDAESAAEMARLMNQDHLVTKSMGGHFPESIDLTAVEHVLDIACGPGGWAMEIAFAHRDIEVVGIDISETMIAYANAQARVQGLTNASFQVMNALQPLDFPPDSFDLVNARFVVGFMPPHAWPGLIQECLRILRPGGILRLTEGEWGLSNKPAFEKYCGLVNQSLQRAGQSFSPNGTHMGILPMLRPFLQEAGYQHIGHMAHVVDFSYGMEAHESSFQDFLVAFKLVQPFIIRCKVAKQEELDELYQQVLVEMQSEDFCALWILLTVWGYKPEA